MSSVVKKIRDYKVKFKFNSKHENVLIPDSDISVLIKLSKSANHVYTYLATNANRQLDLGYIRGIRTKDICNAFDMPVETVLHALKQLSDNCLVYYSSIGNGIYDICILNYKTMFEEGYTKYPSNVVFSDAFLSFDKATIAGYTYMYYVTFKDIVPKLRAEQSKDVDSESNEYYKYLDSVKKTRTLKVSTILKHMRRNNIADAERVISILNEHGFLNITHLGECDPKLDDTYVVEISLDTLRDIFKVEHKKEYAKSFRVACNSVYKTVCEFGYQKYFNTMQHIDDLVQMTIQYGQGLVYTAIDQLRSVEREDKLVDGMGDEIINVCAYVRTTIGNFLIDISKNDSTSTKQSVINRFKSIFD